MNTPLPIVNVAASDTFGSLISKLNAGIVALSNTALVVAANAAGDSVSGNGFVNGTLGTVTLAVTNLKGGNVASAGSINVISNAVFSFDLGLGGVAAARGNTLTTTGTGATPIDTFAQATYRSGKYVISVKNNIANGYQATELLLMHDDGNALLTEYATLSSNGIIGTFTADISSGNVRLLYTPAVANTTLTWRRDLLTV